MQFDYKRFIAEVPDFPKPGVSFKDITPLVADPVAFKAAVKEITASYEPSSLDVILAPEARGFIWAGALSLTLGKGVILARKKGKLPRETRKAVYELEYGTDELHVHADSIKPGSRVLIFDDVLATGGTAAAMANLVEDAGAAVAGVAFVVELSFLNGRAKLGSRRITSLVTY